MVTFLDFDLHISADRSDPPMYFAEVTYSPAGTSSSLPLTLPWKNEEEKLKLLLKLELAVTRAQGFRKDRSKLLVSAEEKTLQEFGSVVFDAVFRKSKEISELYSKSLAKVSGPNQALRLKLRVKTPDLEVLPWEYVYDSERDDFVCLEEKLPMVRFLDGEASAPVQINGPLRILGMIADTRSDSIDAEKEKQRIVEVFSRASAVHHQFEWVLGGTLADLFQKLKSEGPWHIFHFIGHGGTEAFRHEGVTVTAGYVVMNDGEGGSVDVSARDLARVLRSSNLRLAIMNCCESGRGTGAANLGATLVQTARIPTVVAMQFPISGKGASRFSDQFYSALLQGESVENALTQARNFILTSDKSMEWGIPVLFTRTKAAAICKPLPPKPAAPLAAAAEIAAPQGAPLTEAQRELRRIWGTR